MEKLREAMKNKGKQKKKKEKRTDFVGILTRCIF